MAFPDTTYTDNESAAAALANKAAAAGLDLSGLNAIAQLQSAVANLLVSDPSTVNVPAGDVLAGTFGANKSGGADTGTYTFPGALVLTGALSGVTTIAVSSTATVTSASAVALAVGLAGATNPAFVVDSSTASQAAGLKVTGATAAGNVAIAVISSGAAANLLVNAKGSGTIGIGSVSTGAVTITPATTITGALTQTGLATFNGGATIASGQTLTLTGATVTGLTAASVGAGTFPSGAYVFAGAVSGVTTLAIGGALSGVTSATFSTNLISTTALATPSALAATQFTGFASTVSGAALMGFGTTNDVALMNRAGTVVLGIGPNTTAVNMTGNLKVATGFCCNAIATPQTAYASGGAVSGTGSTLTTPYGYTTAAQADGIVTLVNNIRAALVANGIMS